MSDGKYSSAAIQKVQNMYDGAKELFESFCFNTRKNIVDMELVERCVKVIDEGGEVVVTRSKTLSNHSARHSAFTGSSRCGTCYVDRCESCHEVVDLQLWVDNEKVSSICIEKE